MNPGFYSYFGAASAYGVFAVLLIFSLRTTLQAKLLFIVILVSVLWAALAATVAYGNTGYSTWYHAFESIRYLAWYIFLLKLYDPVISHSIVTNSNKKNSQPGSSEQAKKTVEYDELFSSRRKGYLELIRWTLPFTTGLCLIVLINDTTTFINQPVIGITGHVVMALIGIAIVEQLYKNTSVYHRWAIKYLVLGAGGIFVFDFYFYANALLFTEMDKTLWQARGIVNLVAVPLLVIAAGRSKNWSMNLFISRDVLLNSSAILIGGVYLLLMAGAGYYLREFGGTWGKLGQILFFSLAITLFAVVLFSSQFRANIRVFFGKHFYKNKYDYRVEWLRLTEDLSNNTQGEDGIKATIESLAQVVDARAGYLWLVNEQQQYRNVTAWRRQRLMQSEPANSSLIHFLESNGYVINLKEVDFLVHEYKNLQLPQWLNNIPDAWLIVPLYGLDTLIGFMLLSDPLIVRSIIWEDRDLLKIAAKQVSSHLMVLKTSEELAQARQFEVFTRVSAYMVHDLKNIAAELELVAQNAKRHSSNPDFVEDAFETIEHASSDIKRLLDQLRNRKAEIEKKVQIDLSALIREVVENRRLNKPSPVFFSECNECKVATEPGQLRNVLAHLIENAQQATDNDGEVVVSLSKEDSFYMISIKDTGCGMDEDFIRNRLFKPFDTTKGNAGMGIGMYESQDFIQRSGGDISVHSEPGKGSIITLHLPVMSRLAV